jgi:hypothetical protein
MGMFTDGFDRFLRFGAMGKTPRTRFQMSVEGRPGESVAFRAGTRALIPEEAFHKFIEVEGLRAKRSRMSFVLMLLNVDNVDHTGPLQTTILSRVVSSLSVSTRETDVVGWYETGQILGVLFSEISAEKQEHVAQVLRMKIAKAINEKLGIVRASRIGLSVHGFPDEREPRPQFVVEDSTAEAKTRSATAH